MIQDFFNENDLRTVLFCSKLYELNGFISFSNELQIACKELLERYLICSLQNKDLDIETLKQIVTKSLNYKTDYEKERDFDLYKRRLILWLDKYKFLFADPKYKLIYGPYSYNANIHNTNIELEICGVYKNIEDHSIHLITWFSNLPKQNAFWDIPTILKTYSLDKKIIKKNDLIIHLFDINYSNTYTKNDTLIHLELNQDDFKKQHYEFLFSNIKKLEIIDEPIRLPYCQFLDCPKRKECIK